MKHNSWDVCNNCGGERGLHHYQTMQCPVGGREAPIGRKQEWMTTTFEIEQPDELAALRSRVAELEAGLAKATSELNQKIAYIAREGWATAEVAQEHADAITKEYTDLLKVQS